MLLTLGPNQKQRLWARIDGETFYLQPFALPLPGRGVADAANVVGRISSQAEVSGVQQVTRIDGTLRLGAPGLTVPGIAFAVTPR